MQGKALPLINSRTPVVNWPIPPKIRITPLRKTSQLKTWQRLNPYKIKATELQNAPNGIVFE